MSLNISRFRCYTTSNCNSFVSVNMFRSNGGPNNIPLQNIKDALKENNYHCNMGLPPTSFDRIRMDGLLVEIKDWCWRHTVQVVEIVPLQSVSLNSYLSRKFLQRQGVPQRGLLSSTPSLLVINDLVVELPRGVKAALYVNNTDVTGHCDKMVENAKQAITLAMIEDR